MQRVFVLCVAIGLFAGCSPAEVGFEEAATVSFQPTQPHLPDGGGMGSYDDYLEWAYFCLFYPAHPDCYTAPPDPGPIDVEKQDASLPEPQPLPDPDDY